MTAIAGRTLARTTFCLLIIVLLSLLFIGASQPSIGEYSVIQKIPIAGQGGFDYLTVDEAARRLYVSHGTQVEVLDIDSLSIGGKYSENARRSRNRHRSRTRPRIRQQRSGVDRHNFRFEDAEADRGRAHGKETRCHHL